MLSKAAEIEIETLVGDLPEAVACHAHRIPVAFEERPVQAHVEEDVAPDTLGLFVGCSYPDAEAPDAVLPPHVILYLLNLWDFAEGDPNRFRMEVRRTYLHEIGHFLGLDERDLADRGLE